MHVSDFPGDEGRGHTAFSPDMDAVGKRRPWMKLFPSVLPWRSAILFRIYFFLSCCLFPCFTVWEVSAGVLWQSGA